MQKITKKVACFFIKQNISRQCFWTIPGNNPTMEELEELIEDADRDGSGSVDFQVT